ncbi:uncharacterized protein GGS25DRAFT_521899 [Hypoxylon fragiforme]|uniref:uncharacterized protein n=1 Tax=Hypoxylon fragiforme TaxID=63214 RepID=UPI0020C60CC1|nr:uncharacterized protein GGS25DRAFT_521899 [Hypoxylon fragiforme]KAI2608728.1 hypothetical protein GGS25DRAFT_521899 [Hypoxylon fragiforme]
MQFSIVATLAFALGVVARPQIAPPAGGIPPVPGDVTVGQAGDTCGSDLDLSCCNQVDQSGDAINTASGLLAGLLEGGLEGGSLGLFDGCSKLNVAAVIGLTDILDSQCSQTPACCQHSGMEQEGLVNLGLPCVALGGLL